MVKRGPVTKLKEELSKKEAELAEIRSLMLRKAAEFENARKRWQKEKEAYIPNIKAEILKDFCDVWDNFERAMKTELGENQQTFDSYRKGIELIFSQFSDVLISHGLKQFSCLGEIYDPSRAEVLGFVEDSQVEHGQVIEEIKKGFMIDNKVLRPAQVIVVKKVKKLNDESDADSEIGAEDSDAGG